MSRSGRVLAATLAALAVVAIASLSRSPARDQAAPAEKAGGGGREDTKKEDPGVAAVRKTAEEFAKAFNKGDAKAVAAFWTANGEYTGPDGETVRGREALEKDYAEFFTKN